MKKILIFSLNYYPHFVGGAEVAIKEITSRLSPKDFEFHILTLRFDSDLSKIEKIDNCVVHRIGFFTKNPSIADLKKSPLRYNKYFYQIYAGVYALFLQRKYNFDAIWAMMAHSCAIPAGIFKFFHPKTKYILTLQEGDPIEHIERLAKPVWPLFVYGFKKADIVQSISNFLQNWAVKIGNKNKKVVIPNGVDVKIFAKEYNYTEILDIKNRLDKKEKDFWLITTSRLVNKNAIDDVINAIYMMKDEKYHFAILGIGPEEDNLKNLVKKLNLENRIHFLGQISHEEMPKYLKSCNAFIRASRSEGMGNSFIEAMSAKIPVIATTEGGLSDFIFDNETAYVVEKNSPEQIVNKIKLIEKDLFLKNKIIENSYNMILEKYNWDKIVLDMKREVFDII